MSKELERLVNIAKGCLNYTGGLHGDRLDDYRAGMKKVIAALKAAADPDDRQSNELEKIGRSR